MSERRIMSNVKETKMKVEKKETKKKVPENSFAVIESGSHQYIVRENDILSLEKVLYGDDNKVSFNSVLFYAKGQEVQIGQPHLKNIVVKADVLNTQKDKKVIGMKFKRKTGYKKIIGHRQQLTTVKITNIQVKKEKKETP